MPGSVRAAARLDEVGAGDHVVGRLELVLLGEQFDLLHRLFLQFDRILQEVQLVLAVDKGIERPYRPHRGGQTPARRSPTRCATRRPRRPPCGFSPVRAAPGRAETRFR